MTQTAISKTGRADDAMTGRPEEVLAGPAPAIAPVSKEQRISSLDILRGVALLGILLVNIDEFALPQWNFFAPIATLYPAFSGPYERLNTIVWFLRWIFFEGKMRGLFSMVFGAGVVLMTSRAEKRGSGSQIADIFLRRNMWLVALGMVHAYLIWFGDILVWYGTTALLFLYPCRKLRPRTLLIAGSVLLLFSSMSVLTGGQALQDFDMKGKADAAVAAQQAGRMVTAEQVIAQKAWAEREASWKPDQKAIKEDLEVARSGYVAIQSHRAAGVAAWHSIVYYSLAFCDVLSMMLIGMGLVKNGFLSAQLSNRTYIWVALAGFGISVPVAAIGAWKAWVSGFDLITSDKWLLLPYDIRRAPGTVAIAAVVMLAVKSGTFTSLMRRLAAVGQTALSNYLLTSILCEFVFLWGPFKLYEKLEYYQNFYVVVAVWAVILIWSPLWLNRFQFGPMEWVWRSLTYWKLQPMRRTTRHIV